MKISFFKPYERQQPENKSYNQTSFETHGRKLMSDTQI